MADTDAASVDATPAPSPAPTAVVEDLDTPRGCPFLLAEGGGWRLDTPTRDHRCGAVSPPAALSPEKQARLCLTARHTTCSTYLASMSARGSRLGAPTTDRATRWGLARTTTVIEDTGGLRSRVVALLLDRRRWPAIPAVLLVATLLVLALSGFKAGGSTPPGATASPPRPTATPASTVRPTSKPSLTPEPSTTPPPTTPPTTAPSPTAVATPAPTASFQTYKVKSGDTLSAIAARFGTTSRAIADLSGISVTSTLRVGQVLKIPNA